jgi:hypothetical protein
MVYEHDGGGDPDQEHQDAIEARNEEAQEKGHDGPKIIETGSLPDELEGNEPF